MGPVTVFADVGLIAAEDGGLRDALAELAIRLDLAGAGELLTQLTNLTCWANVHGPDVPGCRCNKKPPDPRPIPRPQPPPRPAPQPKGCDCAQCITHRRQP